MGLAFIALGSNRQDPPKQLQLAVEALARLPRSRVEAVSAIYRNPAFGPVPQPDYCNAAVRLRTLLRPLALLDALQAIERQQGRIRCIRWGPRPLDLDLLLYDRLSLRHPRLRIPHPRMAERAFVLRPLADVASAKLQLPGGTELGTLLRRCPPGDLVPTGVLSMPNSRYSPA